MPSLKQGTASYMGETVTWNKSGTVRANCAAVAKGLIDTNGNILVQQDAKSPRTPQRTPPVGKRLSAGTKSFQGCTVTWNKSGTVRANCAAVKEGLVDTNGNILVQQDAKSPRTPQRTSPVRQRLSPGTDSFQGYKITWNKSGTVRANCTAVTEGLVDIYGNILSRRKTRRSLASEFNEDRKGSNSGANGAGATPWPKKNKVSWAVLLEEKVRDMRLDPSQYRRVSSDDEILARMRECDKIFPVEGSIRMPFWKPWICASFASKDLVGSGAWKDDVGDEKAGSEPWGICDFLRDALGWPRDFIYIDAEQVGMYDVDPYMFDNATKRHIHARVDKTLADLQSTICSTKWESPENARAKRRRDRVLKIDHGGDADKRALGWRNWKRCYLWAQECCSAMVFFISRPWMESINAVNELVDFVNNYVLPTAARDSVPHVYFVVLDGEIRQGKDAKGAQKLQWDKLSGIFGRSTEFEAKTNFNLIDFAKAMMRRLKGLSMEERAEAFSRLGGEAPRSPGRPTLTHREAQRVFADANVFDLSQYGVWKSKCGGGKKLLRKVSDELNRLMDCLEKLVGKGNPAVYGADRYAGLICRDQKDDYGNPVRNRYVCDKRRMNINEMTLDDFFTIKSSDDGESVKKYRDGKLPLIGAKNAEKIIQHRDKFGKFKSAVDLLAIDGIGPGIVKCILPFITFGQDPSIFE